MADTVTDLPAHDSPLVDVELRLHDVERMLQAGDLLGAVGQLRTARVGLGAAVDDPRYGYGLPPGWFDGEGFDVELATARMAVKAVG